MKYLDEYRDENLAGGLAREIRRLTTRPHVLMEVCGGQTHAIVKHGLDRLLPSGIELVHGPGCPVCVTPQETIDQAHAIARTPGVIFCSFGDMLRVPGTQGDLNQLKSRGADVRVVYSPMDSLAIARANPGHEVVFFAIGFETTAPANAMVAAQAKKQGLTNFSLLVSHVLVPPAIRAILDSPGCRIEGFLGPGHVCSVAGTADYKAICQKYRVPIVITGFEPVDLLEGILMLIRQLEEGRVEVENQYARAVSHSGNPLAMQLVNEVFEIADRTWRGVGPIHDSGYRLRPEFEDLDAARRFGVSDLTTREPAVCISGAILRGEKKPHQCPAFGVDCTPEHPLGATMVSGEGACAAYYAFRRQSPHT